MTLYHVIALAIALAAPLLCGLKTDCTAQSFDKVFSLSSIVIAGTLGHAGQNNRKTGKDSDDK